MRVLVLSLVLCLAVVATAQASTVSVKKTTFTNPAGGEMVVAEVTFDGGAGEANDVVLEQEGTEAVYRITDRGDGTLTAGDGCTSDGQTATCTGAESFTTSLTFALGDRDDALRAASTQTRVTVDAGDGADRVDAPGFQVFDIAGGPGDDVLTGTNIAGGDGNDTLTLAGDVGFADGDAGDDTLVGGAGDDVLTPGEGADVARGGDGDDIFNLAAAAPAGAPADTFDGGGGRDRINFSDLGPDHPGVTVDLAATASAGQAQGAGATVTGFEDVIGTVGPDVIEGSSGANSFEGLGGDDALDGRGGDDKLVGGTGEDSLSAGPGDDTLFGSAGADRLNGNTGSDRLRGGIGADTLNGGAGADRLAGQAQLDVLAGGPGDDALEAGADSYRDVARCGRGRDTLEREPFDRRAGCEEQRLVVGRRMLGTESLVRTGTRLRVEPAGCVSAIAICRGTVAVRARTGGRAYSLGRRKLVCDGPPCIFGAAAGYRIPAPVGKAIDAGRDVAFAVAIRFPGPGAVPIRETLTVRESA